MRSLPRLALHLLALTLVAAVTAPAQNSKRLIVENVDESQLVTLRGNTPPPAIAKNDLGRVSSNMRMTDLILVLRRSPEVQQAFDAFVESQYEPNSPNFHQWLTPDQAGEKFGPSLTDIATVSAWLTSHGLSVDGVSKDRMTIRFSGSARQVESTFHTELHNLSVNGVQHFSNMTEPQIPIALDPVVLGPKALSNFLPRPLHRLGSKATRNKETGQWQRVAQPAAVSSSSGLRPQIGFSCGSTCLVEDLTPFDFATIYNLTPLWNAGIDGTGQTIAIAGRSDVRAADVSSFRSTFGLSGGSFTTTQNGPDPGYCTSTASNALCTLDDQIENALDVEWAGATAPKAAVNLVVTQQTTTNDAIYESANYIIQNNTAKIINVSYGNCELFMGTGGNASYNSLWQTAATAGIAVFVASGDAGAPACDQGGDAGGTPYAAQFGLAVSGLASSSWDTAVGGTDLNWGSKAAPYWNTTNNATNGSTAIGYIPEYPWNDTCTTPLGITYIQGIAKQLGLTQPTDADSACNFVEANYQMIYANFQVDISWLIDTVGAGGGASNCTTNSTTNTTVNPDPTSCSGGYGKPIWQGGVTGIPNDSKRDIPDISFFAGNGLLGSAYLICVSDWATSAGTTCVGTPYPANEPTVGEIGGTSAASPAMAGVMALINQKAGTTQGSPNSNLYKLGTLQTYANCSSASVTNSSSCYFNDINTGTISMPCLTGSQNCSGASTDPVGVLSGFAAGVGYDNATGLGSLNVANVVNGWAATTTGTAPSTVAVSANPTSITTAQGTAVTISVTGANGTPTGTVVLTSGSFTSASKSLDGTGAVTFNLSPGVLAVGNDTITANYSGDPTYAANTGTTQVAVTAAPTPTVTVTPASNAINSGQSLNVTAALAGSSGTPAGTVTLTSGSYTSAAQTLSGGGASFTIPANTLSAGTATLTVSFGGDGNYGPASGTAMVTVTQSTFALAATTPAAISRGSSASSTITWTTANNYSANVTLNTCTLNAGGPANSASDSPTCTVSSAAFGSTGSGTATVTTKAATTTGALQKPNIGGWAEGGAVLALLVFFGIPARRRGWQAMLGMLVLLFTLGSLVACGGGGSSGGGGTKDPGTASGTYTFTVKGTGSDPAATTATQTFTVTVN